MSKKLYFEAIMNNGSTKTYNLNEPKSNLTYAQAESAFNVAIQKDLFKTSSGVKPTSLKTSYYQEIIKTTLS